LRHFSLAAGSQSARLHAVQRAWGTCKGREFIMFLGAAATGWKHAKRPTTLLREAGYFLLGLVSLATLTGLYFWLDVPLVAAAFTYLVVLVLLALVSNLSSLIVLSFIAVGCQSYFFAPPIYSFRVDYPQDLITISAFVITSFIVNFLVTRVRDANQRLEATNGALRIENMERKRAEQAQRESEDKFRQIIETGPNLFWSAGAEGKKAEVRPEFMAQVQAILNVIPAYTWYAAPSGGLTFVSKHTADYLGLPKDHPLRLGIDIGAQWDDWVSLLHPDDQEEARKYWSNCLRTGETGEVSYRVRGAQGDYRWFLTRFEPLRASDGTLPLWVGATLDIEELMRAQEALRASERSARSAIDGIAGLVAILAPNGEPETVNCQLLNYFGRSFEELKNWGTTDAVHPEDLPRVLELNERGLASGLPFNFELRLRRFDGEYRWFDTRVVPIPDDSGRIERWYNLLTDIEDRTRALARLEQMQSDFAHMNRVATMGELTASITHEVKQPIASARNNACAARNFLDMQPPDLSEVREALSCVVGDTDRAGEVVERIRALIKKAPARKDAVAIDDATLEVIALTRTEAANNSVSVRTQFAEGLPRVQGDRVQLQQVMLNLIVNAIQAMSGIEQGARELQISIDAVPSEGGVRVGMRDTGPGLSPENLSRLFEPFYTTKPEGMGMGLSICRSIIEAHGGRLWATPCGPQGALFQFTIPATRAEGS
jgi:PAS domain S-box-containing protein